MPSSNRHRVAPVIVEVKPDNVAGPKPTTPTSPGSPKFVRFASSNAGLVTGTSRPLTPTEAWSLYHFEVHARQCSECFDPYAVHLRGWRLCDTGHALAQDVAIHVFHQSGEIYSTKEEERKLVRVEIPHDYNQLRGLLKAMDRRLRTRAPPVISYDRTYPIPSRKSTAYEDLTDKFADVTIEPASTSTSHRKSKHRSVRYRTVVVEDDVIDSTVPKRKEKRGSLYEKDIAAQRRTGYRIEIREPEQREKRERRRSRDLPQPTRSSPEIR